MSQTEESIPAEWVSTIAQAILDADEAGAPARAIARIVITKLRPLIEAQFRDVVTAARKHMMDEWGTLDLSPLSAKRQDQGYEAIADTEMELARALLAARGAAP